MKDTVCCKNYEIYRRHTSAGDLESSKLTIPL